MAERNETIEEVQAKLREIFEKQHGICTWTYRTFNDAMEAMKDTKN